MDFRGEVCGQNRLKPKKYLYYAVPVIDTKVAFCVEKCPKTTGDEIFLYDSDWNNTILTMFNYTKMQTKEYGKYCLPFEPVARRKIEQDFSSYSATFMRMFGDLYNCADFIWIGIICCCVFSAFSL